MSSISSSTIISVGGWLVKTKLMRISSWLELEGRGLWHSRQCSVPGGAVFEVVSECPRAATLVFQSKLFWDPKFSLCKNVSNHQFLSNSSLRPRTRS